MDKWDCIKLKSFCTVKKQSLDLRNCPQKGENHWQLFIWQGTNIQNFQVTLTQKTSGPQPRAGSTDHWDTRPPPKPTAVQALLSPTYAWDDRTPTPRIPPAHQALPGSSFMWNNWSPALLGQAPAWHKTAASTSLPGTPPLGWSQPQLYSLPR
jgi:hypothetical protein